MKKIIICGVMVVITGYSGIANASGFYISGKAGASQLRATGNTLSNTMVTGGLTNTTGELEAGSARQTHFTPSLTVGYEFSTEWQQPVRLELAYMAGGEVKQNSVLNTQMSSQWTNTGKYIQSFPVTVTREQKARVSTLMLNGYYDYTTGTPFTPYITGGVGVAMLKNAVSLSQTGAGLSFSSDTFSMDKTQMAWSLGAGVAWALTPSLSLDAGYLFTNAGEITTEGIATNGAISAAWKNHSQIQMHTLQLGLRYRF